MATDLGLLSLNHHQKPVPFHHRHHPPPSHSSANTATTWMWNPTQAADEEDDSWEVRAFIEDHTSHATWPPRSYTCTFCRREFRSAQALGGHMNVHRRDRAQLQYAPPGPTNPVSSSSVITDCGSGSVGPCYVYSLRNPNACVDYFPSTLLPFVTYPSSPAASPSINSTVYKSSNYEPSPSAGGSNDRKSSVSTTDGVDLELRLGPSSWPS
ncbi:hypothetical protein NMG60_11027538 [Bertholletia excelsa]